jgi:hypothetical protein
LRRGHVPFIQGNKFGSISSGFAVLYGPVIRAKVILPPENYGKIPLQHGISDAELCMAFDCPVSEALHPDGYRALERSRKSLSGAAGELSVVILVLGLSQLGDIICIVLGGTEKNQYQPIGYVRSLECDIDKSSRIFDILEAAKEEVVID